ncbi:MAG: transporter [Desulfovibrionaceae bacterium]|nr:transporter [Desulfovibrionaceae bacterium]
MKRASVYFVMSLLFSMFAVAATAQASGFGLFEWGNAALGQGTAFYANGDDPSVVAYNPAQMTRLEGTQVYGGITAISPYSKVKVDGSGSATSVQVFAVPHAYVTHQVNDKLFIGMGEFTRFGLGTKFEDYWAGQTLLREARLESFSFNPSVAYKVTDNFSVAAGIEAIKGTFYVTKAYALAGGAPLNVDVEGTSLTGNIGLLYDFNDMFSVGFSYRAPVSFTGDGDAEVDGILPKTSATVEATFPDQYSLGFGYRPLDDLSIEFDLVFTRWELFDSMEFDFGAYTDKTETFCYKNAWRFQLGAEYMATENWALRAGFVYDQTPTRHAYASMMLPANDRFMYTLGVGYKLNDLTVDVAGMYLVTKERYGMNMHDGAVSHSVDYTDGRTLGLGLSFGYKF